MAAPPLGIPREEGAPHNLKSYLLDFTKFREEHPDLSPDECANMFSGVVTGGHSAVPVRGESVSSDLRAVNRKTGSCPGGNQPPAPPLESQQMSYSNSTSSYPGAAPTTQQTFAFMSGRSPHQFQVSNSVTCRPAPLTTPQKTPQPTLEDIQSMFKRGDESLALSGFFSQEDSSEPFHLLRHSVSSTPMTCGGSADQDYSFTLAGSPGICAPRMQPQLSSSPSGCYAGGDESCLGNPGLLSFPMTRHSRSYSDASHMSRSSYLSSQGESTSPTDCFPYPQNSWAPMSRQASNASLTNGTMMLRLSSSTGNSTSGNGGGDYGAFCSRGDMDTMLNGVGPPAGDAGLSLSLDKATGQHMLKRPSSTSVEDLDRSLALTVEHEMQRDPSTASEGVKSRRPKRVKEEADPAAAVQGEVASAATATGHGALESGKQGRQAQRKGDSGSPANHRNPTTTDKTTRHESIERTETTGNLPAGGRVLAASKTGKSGPKDAAVPAAKPSYVRPSQPRVHCKYCNDCPDGFRGDHELRRHTEREHTRLRKMFVIKDISLDGQFLAKCKVCQSGKKYGIDYNAAAHLRRQHFDREAKEGAKKKKMTFNASTPDMATLRKWIEEVEVEVEDGEYPSEEQADDAHESVNNEPTSAEESEKEDDISRVSNPENTAVGNSTAPVAVAQDGALGISGIPMQQDPFAGAAWEQPANWCESGNVFDLSHNYAVQYSVTGGSIRLADALNPQNNAAEEQSGMSLPQQQLLFHLQPSAGGETASTIFGNLPGPAAAKDTAGMFDTCGNDLTTMIPDPDPIFEVEDL
ncbi:unnamed protein product, partial [Tuber aestivum]